MMQDWLSFVAIVLSYDYVTHDDIRTQYQIHFDAYHYGTPSPWMQ